MFFQHYFSAILNDYNVVDLCLKKTRISPEHILITSLGQKLCYIIHKLDFSCLAERWGVSVTGDGISCLRLLLTATSLLSYSTTQPQHINTNTATINTLCYT